MDKIFEDILNNFKDTNNKINNAKQNKETSIEDNGCADDCACDNGSDSVSEEDVTRHPEPTKGR